MVDYNFLVKDKTSNYAILLPKITTSTIMQAASELNDYLLQSTGITLPILNDNKKEDNKYISIGRTKLWEEAKFNSDYEKFNHDGFLIKTISDNVVIDAKTDRGYLYAVYELIERLIGVRFLSAKETLVPKNNHIILETLNIFSAPAFKLRTFLNYPTYFKEKDEAYTSHSRTLHNWFDLSDNYGGAAPLYSRGRKTHNSRFFLPAEKYGTKESTGYEGQFLSKEEGYDPHPEFYIMEKGHLPVWEDGGYGPTIDWANGITEDGKLDESKEISVIKIVIEEMKKDILANPDKDFFQIDQEDCVAPVIDQELIKKYKASGVVIRFCNIVATELQKWANEVLDGRKINIVTFAYQQTMHAPVIKNENGSFQPIDSTVIPVDNLFIRLAYMSFQYYAYNDYRQPIEVLDMIYSWISICKRFWFWGYDSNFNDYIVYNPTLGQVEGTVKVMKEIGVEYFIMLSSYNEAYDWQADLKQYVWTKLLWDVDLKVAPLCEEYLNGYYRSAAVYVKRMIAHLDKRYDQVVTALEPGHDEYNCYHEIGLPKNIDGKLLEDAISIIEEGEDKIITDDSLSFEEKEILLLRLSRVKFTPVWNKLKFFKEFYPQASRESMLEWSDYTLKLLHKTGIKFLNESSTIEDAIKKQYENI